MPPREHAAIDPRSLDAGSEHAAKSSCEAAKRVDQPAADSLRSRRPLAAGALSGA
jgi:hypothetical protein